VVGSTAAYERMCGLLESWAQTQDGDGAEGAFEREPESVVCDALLARINTPDCDLDLRGVGSVIWATGWTTEFPYAPPAFQESLQPNGCPQESLTTPVEGFYVLGFPFLRTTMSQNVVGFEADAEYLMTVLRPTL